MEFDKAVAELDALVHTLEREGDERALLLLQLIDAIHRPALAQIVAGQVERPEARALLAMYDLVEVDDLALVEEALDEMRPYIHSHGGEVELLDVQDGAVHLRLAGACDGCAGAAMTLRRGIEQALRDHYPGFREIIAAASQAGTSDLLQIAPMKRPVFVDVAALAELDVGALRAVDADGVPVLLANVDDEVYAFKNACPVDGRSLEEGRLSGTVVVCPWHNCAFDARTGRRVDDEEQPGLAVVPLAVQEGAVRVAVNVA